MVAVQMDRRQAAVIRRLFHLDELEAANRFEAEIWGASDPTPVSLLVVFAHHGGIVLGAYEDERLVGLSLGFPGLDRQGTVYLHSHLLGVLPEFRRHRLGEALKRAQWDYALERGLAYIGWTYDPLMEGNAWFNLGVLGAHVEELQANVYGTLNDALNGDFPTHRFWIRWNPQQPPVVVPSERTMPIPRNVLAFRHDEPRAARQQADEWFNEALRWWKAGWRIVGVQRDADGVCYGWAKIGHEDGDVADAH
jgi:predicted GNAT superfamily acetyltransferase